MSAICYDAMADDDARILRITARKQDGTALDLTGATVSLIFRNQSLQSVSRAMTVVDALNGIAQYQFAAGELFAPALNYQIKIVDALSKTLHSDCIDKITVGTPIA